MEFWEEVKKDVQRGLKEGMAMVKTGATIAAKKMEELTEEGKKRYKTFDLKTKVHNEIAELGARIHYLSGTGKVTIEDPKASAILNKIRNLQDRIGKLESENVKSAAKKKTGKVVKKTAAKKGTAAGGKTTRKKAASKTSPSE